jgi:dolichol-phosphate mannosyltransferase
MRIQDGTTEVDPSSVGDPELTIVMPVHNEGANIAHVLENMATKVRTPHEVLVVYDFDDDDTVPVVRALQTAHRAVRLQKNELGPGVLNAMRSGIRAAAGDYVLITMADGSDELDCVDSMVECARSGAHVVAASRYMKGGRQLGGPRVKRLLSRIAGLSLYHVFGVPIHDSTSNFKLYSRSFLQDVNVQSTAGFELALELSVKAAAAGRPMAEIPTTWRDRTSGQSRFRLTRWLPHYLRWYAYAVRTRVANLIAKRQSG